jgi:Short C-terminal domain
MFKLGVYRDRDESVRLVNELLASGGTRSPATVLSFRRGRESSLTGVPMKLRLRFITCELAVRVQPEGGAPFEKTFTQVLAGDLEGLIRAKPDALEAIYDPARPDRIALDVVTYREQLHEANAGLQEQLAAWQRSGGVAGAIDAAMASTPGGLDSLERLEGLRASGALSEDEFQAAKARLGL